MKKRLIIELEEDAFRSILGAVLKTSADFRVETIEMEELTPARTLQRKTAEGLTSRELFLKTLTDDSAKKVHKSAMRIVFDEAGFKGNTYMSTASVLFAAGLITKYGDHYALTIKSKEA